MSLDYDVLKYLSVKSHTTLVEKVQAIYQQLHPNEFFRVNFVHDDHHAEILFFLRDVSSSVILTAGHLNLEATQQLMSKISCLNSSPDNICFVGIIDKDDNSKINKCLQKATDAMENRIKEFNYGYKSVSHIDAMSPEEIFEKFFSDQRELVEKFDEDDPRKFYRRIIPMRQAKIRPVDSTAGEDDRIVDLTVDEDDEVSKADVSVTSSCFWEACVSISDSCSDDEKEKMFIRKPVDPQFVEDFVKSADVTFVLDPEDHQVETRSLRSLETEFAPLVAQMYQRQKDEDIERERRWRDEDRKQETKKYSKREGNNPLSIPSPSKDTKHSKSPISFSSTSKTSRSFECQNDSNVSRTQKSTSYAPNQVPNTPHHSHSSFFTHHQIPLTDPSIKEDRKLLSNSPRRDLNETEGSFTKKRLLDDEDYLKFKRNSQIRKFRQTVMSTPASLKSSKIPKSTSPEQMLSASSCLKSPIRQRPPISSRETQPSSNLVDSSLNRLMHNNMIPASISNIIDEEKVVEVIDLDGEKENNNQEGKKRKLSGVEASTRYKIFRNKNKPNFSSFDGSN